jgi:YVTN family beta-propeller protein
VSRPLTSRKDTFPECLIVTEKLNGPSPMTGCSDSTGKAGKNNTPSAGALVSQHRAERQSLCVVASLGTAQRHNLLFRFTIHRERRENNMKSTHFLALVLSCIAAAQLYAADTPQTALLVLSKADQALFIVNPTTLAVVGQVPSGPDPHEVIASADGKLAFISNYGGGSFNTITVVDLLNQTGMSTIDLGALRGPHGLTFVDGKLWFTAEGAKVIGRYDPETKKIDLVLGTGQDRTHMIYVFPDLNRIVTSNVSSATVTLIDKTNAPARSPSGPPLPPAGAAMPNGPAGPAGGGPPRSPQTNWTETVIPVGHGSEGFDVSPDGKEIWVANSQDGTISIIDVANKKVLQTLDVNVKGANRLKFTPDGKLAFVSCLGGPELVVIDVSTRKQLKRVKIGRGAAGILMQPDGLRAFVSCTPDDFVAVIDVKTLQMVGKIAAGKQPDGLAWAVRSTPN